MNAFEKIIEIANPHTSPMFWRWEIRDTQTGCTLRYGHRVCYDDASEDAEKAFQRELGDKPMTKHDEAYR